MAEKTTEVYENLLETLLSDDLREQRFKNLKAYTCKVENVALIPLLSKASLLFVFIHGGGLFSSSIQQYHKQRLKVRNTLVRTFNVTIQPNQQYSSPNINIEIPFSIFSLNQTGDHIQVNIFHMTRILLF